MSRVTGVPDDLAAALVRVVTALRTMSPSRLGAPLPGPTRSRADAGRLLARALAVACQGIEDAELLAMPVWRTLPVVADLVVGDQVNVLAHDLSVAVGELTRDSGGSAEPPGVAGLSGTGVSDRARVSGGATVWTPDGRVPLADVLRDVAATTDEVQRLL